jgi:hypothetical protein
MVFTKCIIAGRQFPRTGECNVHQNMNFQLLCRPQDLGVSPVFPNSCLRSTLSISALFLIFGLRGMSEPFFITGTAIKKPSRFFILLIDILDPPDGLNIADFTQISLSSR